MEPLNEPARSVEILRPCLPTSRAREWRNWQTRET